MQGQDHSILTVVHHPQTISAVCSEAQSLRGQKTLSCRSQPSGALQPHSHSSGKPLTQGSSHLYHEITGNGDHCRLTGVQRFLEGHNLLSGTGKTSRCAEGCTAMPQSREATNDNAVWCLACLQCLQRCVCVLLSAVMTEVCACRTSFDVFSEACTQPCVCMQNGLLISW